MANTLTNLAADIYRAADIVGRELVGFIPASTVNASDEQVAVGQNVLFVLNTYSDSRGHFTVHDYS